MSPREAMGQAGHKNGKEGEGDKQLQPLDLEREDLQQLVLADRQVILGSAVAAALGITAGDLLPLQNREYEVISLGNKRQQRR